MKSVLISIQPKWCEKIVSGEKTIEIRKTRPKIEIPFKCYIYCTYGQVLSEIWHPLDENRYIELGKYKVTTANKFQSHILNGKVIGEFVCDNIDEYYQEEWTSPAYDISDDDLHFSCLHCEDMYKYGKGKTLYAWKISDLIIYDEPKEFTDFKFVNSVKGRWNAEETRRMTVTKPPQSWCYAKGE